MRRKLFGGTTNATESIFVLDSTSTNGVGGLAALAFNTSNLVCEYRRARESVWTPIPLTAGTLGTPSGSATDGTLIVDGNNVGAYELGIPDNVLAAGATWAIVRLYGAANMTPLSVFYELDAIDYQNAILPCNVVQFQGDVASWFDGMVPSGGAANNEIHLDINDAEAMGDCSHRVITIVRNTGAGQSRVILSVSGANPRVAVVDRDWETNPDATSQYYWSGTADISDVSSITQDIDENSSRLLAIKTKTDTIPANPAVVGSAMTLTSGERTAIANVILSLADAVESGETVRGTLRLLRAFAMGLATEVGGVATFMRKDGTPAYTVTHDALGNRSVSTVENV